MRSKTKFLTALVILMLFGGANVFSQSFNPIFNWINRFQDGAEIDLKIKVTLTNFAVFRSNTTYISEFSYKNLLDDENKKQLPQLEVIPKGLIKKFKINDDLYIKEISKDDGSNFYQKLEYSQISSHPIDQWSNFIKTAFSYGLREYENIIYEGVSYVTLYFNRHMPSSLKFRNQTLSFNDEFYHYMKFVKNYPPYLPNKTKAVILVHDPHWSINGLHQLVSGLNLLINTNASLKFRFLVEGSFTEETQFIPIDPLIEKFSKDIPKAPQAFSLLDNFMIDGSMAYRIIYNPELPAMAIDNVELIKQTPPELDVKSNIEVIQTLAKLDEKLRSLGTSYSVNDALLTLIELFNYENAKVSELHGQDLIDYYYKIDSLYTALSKKLVELKNSFYSLKVKAEILFLNDQAEAYKNNAKRFEYALGRDRTMVNNIAQHFNSDLGDRVPIVFIGSFHTSGMTSMLQSKGIGYIVIEPQYSVIVSKEEQEKFNRALNPNTRYNYFNSLLYTDLKLPAGITSYEINEYYAPYLTNQAPKIANRIKRRKDDILKLIGSKINFNMLENSTEQNGNLIKASIGFGGGGNQVPPSDFHSAFAHFDPQGNGLLFIYNEKDSKWENKARYNYLAAGLFILPFDKYREQTRRAQFYQDKESNIIFCSIYDANSNKFYLFEGEDAYKILPLLNPPKPKEGEKDTSVQIRTTIIKIKREKYNG